MWLFEYKSAGTWSEDEKNQIGEEGVTHVHDYILVRIVLFRGTRAKRNMSYDSAGAEISLEMEYAYFTYNIENEGNPPFLVRFLHVSSVHHQRRNT